MSKPQNDCIKTDKTAETTILDHNLSDYEAIWGAILLTMLSLQQLRFSPWGSL